MEHPTLADSTASPGSGALSVARLFEDHAPAILAYIRLRTGSREEAEDLLLDVFLAALEQTAMLEERPVEAQRAWLRGVAAHKIADHYRRGRGRQPVALEQVAETLFANEAHSPEGMALSREEHERLRALLQRLRALLQRLRALLQRLRALLQRLPPLQRQVISLRFVYGLRCDEIAEALGKKESAVRKLLWRALTLARARYAEEQGERDR